MPTRTTWAAGGLTLAIAGAVYGAAVAVVPILFPRDPALLALTLTLALVASAAALGVAIVRWRRRGPLVMDVVSERWRHDHAAGPSSGERG